MKRIGRGGSFARLVEESDRRPRRTNTTRGNMARPLVKSMTWKSPRISDKMMYGSLPDSFVAASHSNSEGIVDDRGHARENRTRQLLRRQLSAVLCLEAGSPRRRPRRPRKPASTRNAAGAISTHSLLPEAVQVLLLSR